MMGWGYGPGMMGGWFGNGYGIGSTSGGYWWYGLIGMAIQLAFWIGIIALVIYAFRRIGSRPGFTGSTRGSGALEVLRERYARGEIDTEEYNRRKQDLIS